MLTISSGHSADYLLKAVATGRENYYTGAVAAGEPPGRWYGAGAELLGLVGLVDAQDMTGLYEHFVDPRDERFKDPEQWSEADTLGHRGRKYLFEDQLYDAALAAEPDASAERRAELRLNAGKQARHNVAFLDATFSVQKSVTVLHAAFEAQEIKARQAGDLDTAAAWGAHRQAVEDAIWAGNRAALDYLATHAGYSRIGHHGGAAGRWIDAHDWTIASFFQHDSRDHDPQLHIHNAILNRICGADGVWRTLDGRALYAYRGAAAAVGERTMEEHLTRALGVRFASRPDGKAREIIGVSTVAIGLVSNRRRAITPKTAALAAAFQTKFGRAPNALELDRLYRTATFATRKAKSHHEETLEQRLERVDRELRAAIAGGFAQVAHDVLTLTGQPPAPAEWSPAEVIETALADVQQTKAGWTAPDLTRRISDALPDHLGITDGVEIGRLLDQLNDQALPLALPLDAQRPGEDALPDWGQLANGESAYRAPGARLYATPAHVHTERVLIASTAEGGAAALALAEARRFVESLAEIGIELGVDQAAAVRGVLTSGAQVESLVGPAGTGKSFVVGTLAKAWQDPDLWDGAQHRVVGLAASQLATDVLTGEGLAALNITRWLGTQDRLTDGRAGGDDHEWHLRAGDLVVVDESAMANTADLAAIHRHITAAGAKLLLTGDHRQLAAVGAGGAMELMATAGTCYELAEARRFTHPWERDASLRLRDGDQSVLGEYHKHGRLIDVGTREQAEVSAARAWLADTLAGQHSLLIVDTNEAAARVCAALRAHLVRLGRVEEGGVLLGLQGTWAGVGDLVQGRLLAWQLAGYEGNRRGPINREHYRVLQTRDDGGLVVAPVLGRAEDGEVLGERMVLPGSYVAEHLALGYASTVHAAQGLTVDTTHAVITPLTRADALYVGLSRGRHANTAHVTTLAVPDDAPIGAAQDAVHHNPAAVLASTFETAEPSRSALAIAAESATEAESIRTAIELLADAAEIATAGRTARWLDALVDNGHLTQQQRAAIAAEDGAATLSRLLRRVELAGEDPRRVLVAAVAERPLDGARQLTNVLHHRITDIVSLEPVGDSYSQWIPRVEDPQDQRYLATLARAADTRRAELGRQAAADALQWAVDAFGPPPADARARELWERRAGVVAAHRELAGHDDPVEALAPPPRAGQVEAYAAWRAAWRALGRPEADRAEQEMSDGQLRLRVRAYDREKAWAPRYVANELAGTIQAADRHRRTATLRAAETAAAADSALRARLEREATEAGALADVLDQRVAQLRTAEHARGLWLAHTAATRAAADRATAELTARRVRDERDEPVVTAEEWLAAHQVDARAEDAYREVTDETDLTEVVDERARNLRTVDAQPHLDSAGPDLLDVREVAAVEPAVVDEDTVRVPTADETAESIRRAQRALTEIAHRQAADEARAAEEARAAQLARWHADDLATERDTLNRSRPALDVAALDD